VEQPHGAGELPPPAAIGEIGGSGLPQPRQRPRERDHLVELLLVAPPPPPLVVAVLAPAGRVRADGLQVAAPIRADPHVRAGGRERGGGDRPGRLQLVAAAACSVEVLEAAAAPAATDAGLAAVGSAETVHSWNNERAAAAVSRGRAGRRRTAPRRRDQGLEISSTTCPTSFSFAS